MPPDWRQLNLTLDPAATAEEVAVHHLAPRLTATEETGHLDAWFIIRKAPVLRLRYRTTTPADQALDPIDTHMESLKRTGLITDVTRSVYEPETRAFGGAEGMRIAHRFFHHDTRHALNYLASLGQQRDRRCEVSLLLCSGMLRAAGLDWYEQGDVWTRVAEHRQPLDTNDPGRAAAVRRLLSVDTNQLTDHGQALHFATEWLGGYTAIGTDLAATNAGGRLRRGLRAVFAHHIVFCWNRLGLPITAQAALATAAATSVFGADPTRVTPQDTTDRSDAGCPARAPHGHSRNEGHDEQHD